MKPYVPPNWRDAWNAKVLEARELRKKNARLRNRVKELTHEGNLARARIRVAERDAVDARRSSAASWRARAEQWEKTAKESITREVEWTARAEKAERQVTFLRNLLYGDLIAKP